MYFITTFTKLEKNDKGFWDFGSQRSVGYYEKLEDAKNIVINNVYDLCETIYEYALIERIKSDCIYPIVISQELYKVTNMTKIEGKKEVYNLDLKYERIKLPEDFVSYSIAIG